MSNETDLDWLVRVTGGIIEPWCEFIARSGLDSWACARVFDLERHWFTREQYLARRAELQNKPSWGDAPEWAEWLAQDQDGEWKWLAGLPGKYVDGWTAVKIKGCCKGLALGDWRDTLEKRPEQFNPSIEEANRLAKEFKPFTGIEDNQEQAMAQKQEMKQDNRWFERGELPPVGTVCEVLWNEGRLEYLRTKVFGVNEHGQPIHRFDEGPKKFEYQADPLVTILGTRVFRPIRTERDVLIEIIKKTDDTDDKIADAILAAGFSLGAK